MKKTLLTLALLAGLTAFAQKTNVPQSSFDEGEDEESAGHELKLGAVKMFAGPVAELTYEYLYRDTFTFGASVLNSFDSQEDHHEEFSITPFARYYFSSWGDAESAGGFVEGWGKYFTGRGQQYNYSFSDLETISFNAFAAGVSLGEKWVIGLVVIEGLAGAGKTFGNEIAPAYIGRLDINIGWRF